MLQERIIEVDKVELLNAIRHDCVTFFAFYLEEKLTLEVPEFHQEIWQELLDLLDRVNALEETAMILQKLFAVPRGHAKTTVFKLAVILFMRYSRFSFTLYVSKTGPAAKNAVRDISMYFKSPQDQALYGNVGIIKENETEAIWMYKIGTPLSLRPKEIILRAAGWGQQVRGSNISDRRPELIIMDDIEDYETADSVEQQDKLDTWVVGTLIKSAAPVALIVFLGNMVRSTTLLARLSKDPEWNPTVFGCLVKDSATGVLLSLWHERWSVEYHLKDYLAYRRVGKGHVWETEMMNLSGDKLLTQSLDAAVMTPWVNPEEATAGFIILDPAYGKESWHDESAITVHIKADTHTDLPILCELRHGRWTETQVFDQMLELSYYWGLRTWVIEANAAQKLWIPLLKMYLIERQIPLDTILVLPLVLGNQAGAKASRILAFRNAIAAKSYALCESMLDFKLLLEEYSPNTEDHDDRVDSASMGPSAWAMCGEMVMTMGRADIAGLMMQTELNHQSTGELSVARF